MTRPSRLMIHAEGISARAYRAIFFRSAASEESATSTTQGRGHLAEVFWRHNRGRGRGRSTGSGSGTLSNPPGPSGDRDRRFGSNMPARGDRGSQGIGGEDDARRMGVALAHLRHQDPIKEDATIIRGEDSRHDHPFILIDRQAIERMIGVGRLGLGRRDLLDDGGHRAVLLDRDEMRRNLLESVP